MRDQEAGILQSSATSGRSRGWTAELESQRDTCRSLPEKDVVLCIEQSILNPGLELGGSSALARVEAGGSLSAAGS